MVRFWIGWLAGLLTATAIVGVSPVAHAAPDPYHDPHHPNYVSNWCPGGGYGGVLVKGWCDGLDYPDGSFWHQAGYFAWGSFQISSLCKLHTGLMLADAGPGGCGGEV